MTNAPQTTTGRIGGYAPGGYLCRCMSCNQTFIGDKRAVSCLPCAVAKQEQPMTNTTTLTQPAAYR